MVHGERVKQRSDIERMKTQSSRLLLGLGLIAVLFSASGCAAGQGNGSAGWTLGPTLAPSSAEPSTGTSQLPSESSGPQTSPAAS